MRATRAYAASVGTTGVLILCSLLMLALVSGIVAFNGWPGGVIPDRIESVLVGDGETSLALEGPDQVAADAAPAAAAVATAALPGSGAPRGSESGVPDLEGLPAPVGEAPGTGDPTPPGPGTSPPSVVAAPPLIDTPDASMPDVAPVVDGLLDTTAGLVGQLGVPIGDTVSDTGGAVTELVDELRHTTDGLRP